MLDLTEKFTHNFFTSEQDYYLPTTSSSQELARNILNTIIKFKRIEDKGTLCSTHPCEKCMQPHLLKILSLVKKRQPITMILPAFPGKSPNPLKVLGTMPDMAEKLALQFLQSLCDKIKQLYSPGAHITLCSDGRVFSDVVGMKEENVTGYKNELLKILDEFSLNSISTFTLDDLHQGNDFYLMRKKLVLEFGESLENLKLLTRQGGELNRLYCGITRFLVEDAQTPEQNKSKAAIQKECRLRAYTLIQRSQAWSKLVETQFHHAVRLSIHPQNCGSKKLGIRLIESEQWLTPWHGVAVEIEGKFHLLKRKKAEELGARLVFLESRPSHYVLD